MSKKPEFADLFFSKTKDFLDIFLKSQEQRSRDTIKAYRISLSSFYKYVTDVKGMKVMQFCFSDCTYEFVLSYSQYPGNTKTCKQYGKPTASCTEIISEVCF